MREDPWNLADEVLRARIFDGMTVWGPGQLENEISQGCWARASLDSDYLFAEEPEALFRRISGAIL
jgi:putative AlgH/UPF0301 family transcriptional regulator